MKYMNYLLLYYKLSEDLQKYIENYLYKNTSGDKYYRNYLLKTLTAELKMNFCYNCRRFLKQKKKKND